MAGGQLNAGVDQYLAAAGMNVPPPAITSDPLVGGSSPIEQLLRILGLAANGDDPLDDAEALDQHARRDTEVTAAAENFANQDQNGAAQMAQQIPQLASGIAAALTGGLQAVSQIPQQLTQGAQQAVQAVVGAFQSGGSPGVFEDNDLPVPPFPDESDTAADEFDPNTFVSPGAGSASGGSGVASPTSPTAVLGPPPVPSPSTSPAAAPVTSATSPQPTPGTRANSAGVAGAPMVPPGAFNGAGTQEKDVKPDTKRVSAPVVRNGAPVQGRIVTPPAVGPVTTTPGDRPVVTRRTVVTQTPE